jgi:hypothetical protein
MQIKRGTVIFRHWNEQDGLNEIARGFKTLEELFNLCSQSDGQLLVERVIIDGEDDDGTQRALTLVFQSVTLHDTASSGGD